MNIEIKKKWLSGVTNFLMELKLSGRLSRARIKLIKSIDDAVQELQEDIQLIEDEKVHDDEDKKKLKNELADENAVLDLTRHKALIKDLHDYLEDDYEEVLDGVQGFIHDVLLDAIEAAQTKNGDDE